MKRERKKIQISAIALLKGREMVHDSFESRIFFLPSQNN